MHAPFDILYQLSKAHHWSSTRTCAGLVYFLVEKIPHPLSFLSPCNKENLNFSTRKDFNHFLEDISVRVAYKFVILHLFRYQIFFTKWSLLPHWLDNFHRSTIPSLSFLSCTRQLIQHADRLKTCSTRRLGPTGESRVIHSSITLTPSSLYRWHCWTPPLSTSSSCMLLLLHIDVFDSSGSFAPQERACN